VHQESASTARTDRALSPRQLEVLEMAARGLTNNETAERLSISVHAVKYHLAGAYRKLGASNRTEAAVAYLRSLGPPERAEGMS
jgi:DNA-binding CsgD family transcriptional regulator